MRIEKPITDEQAIDIAKILLKTSISRMYNYAFEKVTRRKYDTQDGTDAEESINIYFNFTVKEEAYKTSGWQDEKVMINIIIHDRYHDFTYFSGNRKAEEDKTWKTFWLSNQIEATIYLLQNNLIDGEQLKGLIHIGDS
jgi:predicted SprT family Zn-dependent metalloprotease